MRLLALPLILLAVTTAPVTAQKSTGAVPAKITLLGEVRDSVCDEVSISPNERLVACATLKPDFRIIDLSAHKTTVLFKGMFVEDLFWSRAGDQIAFSGREDGSKDFYIWTVGVDSRTGQQTTPPRRVSASSAGVPAYSPDAQFIAYHQPYDGGQNNRKLVVVPATGGAERILAEGDIFGPYAWSSDAKWIYFPKFTGPRADSAYSIFRVPASAGPTERVSDYQSIDKRGSWFYHGASRDGRFIAIGTRSMNGNQLKAVLDPQGKLLGVATLPGDLREGTSSDYDWMPSGSRLFLTTKNRPTVLRSLNVADGSARDLVSSSERPRNPSFSSDGKRIAVQAWNGSRFDIAIMNADGTGRKFLNTASEPRANAVVDDWSPDGRYLAYVDALGHTLHVVDLASGKDTRLATEVLITSVRWSRDSRSLRFVAANGTSDARQNSFRIVGLDGRERVVRDVGGGPPAYLFVGDDSVLKVQAGLLIPFGPGTPRLIHEPTNIRPKPGVSPDGRWIAFMPNGIGNGQRPGVYEMTSTDSPSRLVVHLPPGVQSTAPLVSPDNRSLIVPTAAAPGQPARILLVPVNGDSPRTLATLAAGQELVNLTVNPDWYFDAVISPDGKTLLYSTAGAPVQQFFNVDLTPALAPTQAGKPGAP